MAQNLVAAGVTDEEARDQLCDRFNISDRSARKWLEMAYGEMAAEAEVDRRQLVGLALRRRRIAAARALRDGDTRAYLAACDSESRLLGLDMPARSTHTILVDQVQGMSRAVVETIADFYRDDPETRARFIEALRSRLNAQLAQRPDRDPLVIDVEVEGEAQLEAGNGAMPSEGIPTASEGSALIASEASVPCLAAVATDVAPVTPNAPIAENAPSPA